MPEGMKPKALNVYKYWGETPLMCLQRLQAAVPELAGEALTYAGRLDPLAEGVLLVLVGEEAKRKELYLGLRKSYRFDVLFGFTTDTYDIAGKLCEIKDERVPMISLMSEVSKLESTFEQLYPPYSSKPVQGKPLFEWARENRLHEIEIPHHTVTVYRSLLRHSKTILGGELEKVVEQSIRSLRGDFRQEEILDCWRINLQGRRENLYDVSTLEVECSSGTYMRSLAHDLGKILGIPALALQIIRTSVGGYTLEKSLRHSG